jgi:adenosine deaminase/adenosine deaminase CECR1
MAGAQSLPPASDVSALTAFLARMPKGGDIHHHYSGAIYAETYLDWAQRKGMRLDPASLQLVAAPNGVTIDSLRNNTILYRQALMAWSDIDYGNHSHDAISPDLQFFGTFGYFGAISNAFMDEGLREIKARAVRENVLYIETMLKSVGYSRSDAAFDQALGALVLPRDSVRFDALVKGFYAKIDGDTALAHRVASFTHAVDSLHRGIDDSAFTMRFQTYVSRNSSPSVVFSGLVAAFRASAQDPLVVGVNIVGPENGVVAMRDERLHARMFRFLRRIDTTVRVSMHAGELRLGLVKPEDLGYHINDAVFVAGANRIGHGVDLPYEESSQRLLDTMAARKTCVEVNLTSNEFILGISGASHPLNLYRKAGVPVVLSTDDPGVSRNSLTSEYVLLANRYGLGYGEIKAIVRNSIVCSFLDEATKKRLLAQLDQRFQGFEAELRR